MQLPAFVQQGLHEAVGEVTEKMRENNRNLRHIAILNMTRRQTISAIKKYLAAYPVSKAGIFGSFVRSNHPSICSHWSK
jgi:hypothetical protein